MVLINKPGAPGVVATSTCPSRMLALLVAVPLWVNAPKRASSCGSVVLVGSPT